MNAGWVVQSLGELCEFQRGLTYAKGDEVEISANVVLRATNIDLATNLLDLTELKYISESVAVPSSKKVRKGSLMICTASGSKSHLGKVAFIDDDYDFAYGGFMGMITPKSQLLPKYLFHLMTSDAYKDFIAKLSDGANINNLKFDDLKEFQIPHPDRKEQARITYLLDNAFDGITTVRAAADKSLQSAKALRASHAQSVFSATGEGWIPRTVDQVSHNLDSQRVPITKSDRKRGEYPYYGASGVVDYVADYIFEGDALLVSEDGANLLMRATPIAFSVSGRYWVNNHAHILRFASQVTQRFVEYYLESIRLDGYITGAAQPKLTQKALNSIPIPIPNSVESQSQVVGSLESVSRATQRLVTIYQRKLAALDALKKSLLHLAFTGRL